MRASMFLSALVLGALAVAVYQAKHRAGEARHEIVKLEVQRAELENELGVLRAEEAHLTRPERIAGLAREYLGMSPVAPAQFGELADLNTARPAPLGEKKVP